MLRTALFLALALATAPAFGLGSEFTYQGTLTDNGAAANGSYDLQFTLQDSRDIAVGTPLLLDNVAVANGVFTVQLDFGATAFSGAIRKLQIGVRPGTATGAFTTLSPATIITPTPHAQVAGNALIATTVVDGSIGSAQVADDSITGIDISNSSITNFDLAGNSVSSNVIADDSIMAQDIAPNAVTSSELGTNAVTTTKINDSAVTATKIADSAITSAKIASGAITDSDIASRTITGQSIAIGGIDDTNLAGNSVTSAKIADGTIAGADIAQGTVANANLALNAVTTSRIADGTITDADIAANSITSQSIANGSIGAIDVQDNAFWKPFGNSGTNPAVHFLGTSDGQPLQLKAAKVGINTATPSAALDVYQPGGADTDYNQAIAHFAVTSFSDVAITRSGNGPAIKLGSSGSNAQLDFAAYDNVRFLTLRDGMSSIGLKTVNSPAGQEEVNFELRGPPGYPVLALKPGGGPWDVLSDIRLKHNVQPLSGALDHLLQLRSVTFQYNDGGKDPRFPAGVQTGFVAQEVQAVFPDWVNRGSDGYFMVGPKGFESLTVQALRELRAEKDDEIAALKDENAALRARLDAIEARLGSR